MLQAEAGWLSYLNDLDEIIIDVPLAVSLFSTLLLACLHLNLVNLSCIVFPFALFHSFSPSYLKFPCQHLIFCPLPIISPSLLNQHFVTLHYITLQGTYASQLFADFIVNKILSLKLLHNIREENNFSFSSRYAEFVGQVLKAITELNGKRRTVDSQP